MDNLLNEIRVPYLDVDINGVLAAIPDKATTATYAIRYNQGEELFLELGTEIFVPRYPIHHDVRQDMPSAPYAYALRDFIKQLSSVLPEIFHGLTYFFDPSDINKPRFYRLYKVEDSIYLYHLRIDLKFRSFEGEIMEPGTNDITPAYRTKRIFLESEIVPLEAVMWDLGRARAFKVKQLISNTWIGETGRGYLTHGIWMDTDLSKFFSKLFLHSGQRTYPFYPLFCKYKTICAEAPSPGPAYRKRILPLLHRAIAFLAPEMDRIQGALKNPNNPFSETLPEFLELFERVPPAWREPMSGLHTKSYLNEREMKEYSLEIPDLKN